MRFQNKGRERYAKSEGVNEMNIHEMDFRDFIGSFIINFKLFLINNSDHLSMEEEIS
jgi:hypothetical protein